MSIEMKGKKKYEEHFLINKWWNWNKSILKKK